MCADVAAIQRGRETMTKTKTMQSHSPGHQGMLASLKPFYKIVVPFGPLWFPLDPGLVSLEWVPWLPPLGPGPTPRYLG